MNHLPQRAAAYTLLATAVTWAFLPRATAADTAGYHAAPPIEVRIAGEPSGFYAGSVTKNATGSPYTDAVAGWRHKQYGPLADRDMDKATAQAAGVTPGTVTFPQDTRGQSSGLAITLALLDAATEGSLLPGGLPVAATGTMDTDGHVGPIDGVQAKEWGVRDAGITILLVPEVGGTAGVRDGVTVIPVATVQEAVAALCQLGATSALCGHNPTM